MSQYCTGCGDKLLTGDKIFQLAWGQYMRGYITPICNPWNGILAEWHRECLPVQIIPQMQPYFCVVCEDPVDDGDQVAYITVGDKPEPPYRRLEGRGYELAFITHLHCWPAPPCL